MIDQPQTEAHIRSLSELLEDTKRVLTGERVSVAALVEALHERGIAMILLIFAAPMALPLPVPPGINIMLATPLILLTLQQAMGRRTVWLPQKTLRKEFDSKGFSKLIDGVVPWMKRIEILLRPRLGFLTRDTASRAFGVLGVIMALTVCIALPLTNTVPSLGIALMSVGFMMRDGLAVLGGALIGTAWVCMLAVAELVFGPEAFDIVKETIKSIIM